jgi:hypothetical protein
MMLTHVIIPQRFSVFLLFEAYARHPVQRGSGNIGRLPESKSSTGRSVLRCRLDGSLGIVSVTCVKEVAR